MKIRIVKHTVCGGEAVFQGDEIDASVEDARELINLKKAVPASETSMDVGPLIATTMQKMPVRQAAPKRHRGVPRGKKK